MLDSHQTRATLRTATTSAMLVAAVSGIVPLLLTGLSALDAEPPVPLPFVLGYFLGPLLAGLVFWALTRPGDRLVVAAMSALVADNVGLVVGTRGYNYIASDGAQILTAAQWTSVIDLLWPLAMLGYLLLSARREPGDSVGSLATDQRRPWLYFVAAPLTLVSIAWTVAQFQELVPYCGALPLPAVAGPLYGFMRRHHPVPGAPPWFSLTLWITTPALPGFAYTMALNLTATDNRATDLAHNSTAITITTVAIYLGVLCGLQVREVLRVKAANARTACAAASGASVVDGLT